MSRGLMYGILMVIPIWWVISFLGIKCMVEAKAASTQTLELDLSDGGNCEQAGDQIFCTPVPLQMSAEVAEAYERTRLAALHAEFQRDCETVTGSVGYCLCLSQSTVQEGWATHVVLLATEISPIDTEQQRERKTRARSARNRCGFKWIREKARR